mmetsp:Transcript_17756/g.47290  ORF Transcript_17756/g.47290 Transcript_17756/m.47290 type:complete len:131 (-) Transcript_17756:1366-1758(-)
MLGVPRLNDTAMATEFVYRLDHHRFAKGLVDYTNGLHGQFANLEEAYKWASQYKTLGASSSELATAFSVSLGKHRDEGNDPPRGDGNQCLIPPRTPTCLNCGDPNHPYYRCLKARTAKAAIDAQAKRSSR